MTGNAQSQVMWSLCLDNIVCAVWEQHAASIDTEVVRQSGKAHQQLKHHSDEIIQAHQKPRSDRSLVIGYSSLKETNASLALCNQLLICQWRCAYFILLFDWLLSVHERTLTFYHEFLVSNLGRGAGVKIFAGLAGKANQLKFIYSSNALQEIS